MIDCLIAYQFNDIDNTCSYHR